MKTKEIMKTTDLFKQTIKAYLDNRATEDELFAKSYAKKGKNLDECVNFVLQQVKASGCDGFADEEVFSMAVHYYDEDNIKDVKPMNCRVVVNHKVELTEEEKKEAHEEALKKLQAEQYALLKKKPAHAKRETKSNVEQMSLF